MAAHLDCERWVRAPLALTWAMAAAATVRHGRGHHEVLATDAAGGRTTLRVTTPPDRDGRTWTYDVERVLDEGQHTVYARRFHSPAFRYATAWWCYEAVEGGTRIRCVQDFETMPDAPLQDAAMAVVVERSTLAGLGEVAALVEAAARDTAQGAP